MLNINNRIKSDSGLSWEFALDTAAQRIKGKMEVGIMLINKFFPLTHKDFEITRAVGHNHLYHVVRKHDKKWFQCNYELGHLIFICGNLDYEI